MSQNQNLNQFSQLPVKGQLDLAIMGSGVITGVVSASQATALVPGQKVTIDTAADIRTPSFIAAAYNASAIGTVIYTTRKAPSAYAAATGEAIEVALLLGNCVVQYMEAAAAIAAGARVESTTGNVVSTYGTSNKALGYALDGASAAGKLIRVIMTQQALS
jgi:hypothetical protein